MKTSAAGLGLAILATASLGMSARPQNISIQAIQDSTGVTLSYSGSVDLSGLTPWQRPLSGERGGVGTLSGTPVFMNAVVFNDNGTTPVDTYLDQSTVLGVSDGGFVGSNFTGNPFGFVGLKFGVPAPNTLYVAIGVPVKYISGTALSGSIRLEGASLVDLGLTVGSVSSLSFPGGNTVTTSASVVPEPSEWAAMGAGLCGAVALVRRLRHRTNA